MSGMTLVKQQFRHDPDSGVYGDCHRAAIASLLSLPIDEVPHFGDGGPDSDEFWRRERVFLMRFNMRTVTSPLTGELPDVLRTMALLNGDALYMLGGRSPRDTNHTVVCRGGEIIHDPHPDEGGLAGPCDDGFYWVSWLVLDQPSLAGQRHPEQEPAA